MSKFPFLNKSSKVPLSALLITLIIFTVNHSPSLIKGSHNILEKYFLSPISKNFRSLEVTEDEMEEVCNDAPNKLVNHFQESQFYMDEEDRKKPGANNKYNLNKYEMAIVNFIEDQKYEYVEDYLPHVWGFIFFFVLIIIIIAFWVGYCICCICPRWFFAKPKGENDSSRFRLICFYICLGLYLLFIIFSIVCLCLSGRLSKAANGVACALFKLVFHFIDGNGKEYILLRKWLGFSGVADIFDNSLKYYNEIMNMDNLVQPYQDAKDGYEKCDADDSVEIWTFLKKLNDLLERMKKSNFSQSKSIVIERLNKMENIFKDLRESKLQDIYNTLQDYINKYDKKTCIGVFTASLVIGILGAFFLFIYVELKKEWIRFFYHLLWNIQMVSVIVNILVGIFFGIVGSVGKDSVKVVNYILSKENLGSEKPRFFKFDKDVIDVIDTCFNGDGDMSTTLFASGDGVQDNFFQILQEYYKLSRDNEAAALASSVLSVSEKCQDFSYATERYCSFNQEKMDYLFTNVFIGEKFEDFYDNSLTLYGFLYCRFARSDLEILMDEFKNGLGDGIYVYSILILIGALAGAIEVFFGIIVINRYLKRNDERPYVNKDGERVEPGDTIVINQSSLNFPESQNDNPQEKNDKNKNNDASKNENNKDNKK